MMREQDSYDVYVKVGVDHLGLDDFGAVGHFVNRTNAVALKRRLEAQGATVRIEKSTVRLSEAAKDAWFSDYETAPLEAHEDASSEVAEIAEAVVRRPRPGQKSSWSWWKRMFGG